MERPSSSQRWRTRGNGQFSNAETEEMDVVRIECLNKAIRCYKRALEEAETVGDRASALKNIGKASYKLARTLDEGSDEQMKAFRDAIENTGSALNIDSVGEVKGFIWYFQLTGEYSKYINEALDVVENISQDEEIVDISHEEIIPKIQGLIDIIPEERRKATCYMKMATLLYEQAEKHLENEEFKDALHILKECYTPLERTKFFNSELDVTELEDKIKLNTRKANAGQRLELGNQMIERLISEKTSGVSVNLNDLLAAIDDCQEAIQLCEEEELEVEAIALSHLGRVFDCILEQREKAKDYFIRSVALANAMPVKYFVTHDWYRVCTQTLEKYQKEQVADEEQKKEKNRREIIKDDLKKEMELLGEGKTKYASNMRGLMIFISRNFPPIKKRFELPEEMALNVMDEKELKRTIRKMVLDYHPDSQSQKETERKILVLNEEIAKVLNGLLERIKCP